MEKVPWRQRQASVGEYRQVTDHVRRFGGGFSILNLELWGIYGSLDKVSRVYEEKNRGRGGRALNILC